MNDEKKYINKQSVLIIFNIDKQNLIIIIIIFLSFLTYKCLFLLLKISFKLN